MNGTRIHHFAAHLFHRAFVLLSLVCLSAGILHAQSYTIVDLGTLGGHASGGDGINEEGEVVGWSIDDPYGYYAFKSTPNGPPLLNLGSPPNGSYSYAQSINDYDQVVGYADVTVGFGVYDRAFLWENGTMIDLGTLGGNASQAWAINNAGQVVGWAEDGGPGYQAFIWEDGFMTELPGFPTGYPDSEARGINEAGIAVGHSWDGNSVRQAVVWENGVMSMVLDLIPEAMGAKAYAINNDNQIVAGRSSGTSTATPRNCRTRRLTTTTVPTISTIRIRSSVNHTAADT
jgi:probable HAF family extracellular repeat protein